MATAKVALGVPASIGNPHNLRWMKKGTCYRKGVHNLWASGRQTEEELENKIKTFCRPCPVRGDCLIFAIRQEIVERYTSMGIWGGALPKQRRQLRRHIREQVKCPTEAAMLWVNRAMRRERSQTTLDPSQ